MQASVVLVDSTHQQVGPQPMYFLKPHRLDRYTGLNTTPPGVTGGLGVEFIIAGGVKICTGEEIRLLG